MATVSAAVKPMAGERPTAQSSDADFGRRLRMSVACIFAVGIAGFIVALATSDPNYGDKASTVVAVSGLTMFATFFVAAQALERLLEPIASVLLPKDAFESDYASALDVADKAVAAWAGSTEADRAKTKDAAETALKAAADAKAKLDARHDDRVTLFWAIASVLGIVASGLLNLYFLRAVGISAASRGLEVFATGLVIDAGTKPLHELLSAITKTDPAGPAASNTSTTPA